MKKAGLLLLIVLLVSCSPGQTAPTKPVTVTALSASDFLESLGVNTHLAQGYNLANYIRPLNYLGIRNVRDGPADVRLYDELHKASGVRLDLVVENFDEYANIVRNLAQHKILMAVEGPNEPNNFPIVYKGQRGGGADNWDAVALMQAAIYASVKSDPLLKSIPVFHVSEGGAETSDLGLQFLEMPDHRSSIIPSGTRYADYANTHNYVSGHGSYYSDNQAWDAADPTLDSHWDGLYVEYGNTWKGRFAGYNSAQLEKLPRVTTETGWDTKSGPGGERVQGTILVNTYLAQFKRGWKYTFIYELGDGEGGAGYQGLYRPDWTPKPAADFIHNLTTILSDSGHPASLKSLAYSLSGGDETVHDLLLQKSDGSFYLIIWGEMVRRSQDVTVNLSRRYGSAAVYDVTRGVKPIAYVRNVSKINLMISDHALIVALPALGV